MTVIKTTEGVRSEIQRGKIGHEAEFGRDVYGIALYGKSFDDAGVYQMRTIKIGNPTVGTRYHYKKKPIKMKFYGTPGVHTDEQEATWQKMRDAVVAWHDLTTEQKQVYYTNAVGLRMTGFNLFIKQSLLS